jgi:hypothetical protein
MACWIPLSALRAPRQECITECEHCSSACLQEDNVKMLVRCIELDRSCAYVCALAANEMARGSELAQRVSQLCAEICDVCAEECEKHTKMEHCQRCAEACRTCAEACREMGGAGAGSPEWESPIVRFAADRTFASLF